MIPALVRRRASPPPTIEAAHIPAPVGGLNTVDAAASLPPTDCLQLFNMVAAEYGLRSRLGSREWCTHLGTLGTEVRSILPFTGSAANGSKDKLFACTVDGIYDVTSSSASPSLVQAFSVNAGDAGYGICQVMVTSAGHFLVYTDEENGLYIYTESTTTWAAVAMGGGASQISGVDPASFCFVAAFKERLWFVKKDTGSAWYLAAGAVYGAATEFPLARQFRAGGPLVGLWNWTADGGNGLDSSLVAVSGGGDIVVYQGTDPSSSTTFGLKGVWFAGGLPVGRRIATNFGGDMLLLSTTGVLPLSKLLIGQPAIDRTQYATAKVGNLFNVLAMSKTSLHGWSLRLHPQDNALIVTIPVADGQATTQLVMSLWNRSWSQYRDLPIYSSEAWGGKFYFGTVDGRVLVNDGYIDGVTLADPNAYTPIQWACLTSFQNLGSGRQKRIQMIRPTLLSQDVAPAFKASARFKYNFTEDANVTTGAPGSGSWGSGLWDSAVWAGDYNASQSVSGGVGMGTDMAVAIRGTATSRTILVGMDVLFDQGGLL